MIERIKLIFQAVRYITTSKRFFVVCTNDVKYDDLEEVTIVCNNMQPEDVVFFLGSVVDVYEEELESESVGEELISMIKKENLN